MSVTMEDLYYAADVHISNMEYMRDCITDYQQDLRRVQGLEDYIMFLLALIEDFQNDSQANALL